MKNNAIDLANRELEIAITKSEYKRIKIFITALLLGLLIMSFNFFVIRDTTQFFKNENTKYLIMAWFVAFLTYETTGLAIAGWFLKRKIFVPEFMKAGNVIIEASFPGILLAILCYVEHTVIFLDSPLMFFYFILIIISSMNLEVRLGLITALVTSGTYFLVTFWAIHTFDPQNQVLHFPPILYYARSIFMMIAALSAVYVTNEIKNRTLVSFDFIKQKNEIEMLFGQQVSKTVVDTLIANNFSSDKRIVSILFMDIRNFSRSVENMDPQDVIKFQNVIFSPVIRIISNYKGITNQIMGDGLMATFGAPEKDENHAENALQAGLAILKKMNELSSKGAIPVTRVGLGVHTGKVVMGNIGNELRKQFSISGTTVIIAARLEQVNKEFDTQFLVSSELYNRLNHDKYHLEKIGHVKVRNIEKEIEVFKVA